jgi:hypothetical protein
VRGSESLTEVRRRASRQPAGVEVRRSSGPGALTEWTARPLGRLGRPLLVEIETYLSFFSIARAEAEPDA